MEPFGEWVVEGATTPMPMPRRAPLTDDRLFLPALQPTDGEETNLWHRLRELDRLFHAAQEEIALLTSERDELVGAIKRWSQADRSERLELLSDAATFELRTELKQLRGLVSRLKRENASLLARDSEHPPQQLRA